MEVRSGIIIGLALLLIGCVSHPPNGTKHESQMPPLPGNIVQGTVGVPGVEKLPKTRKTRIIVAWTCLPLSNSTQYVTGIEASYDLRSWSEVVRLPYTVTNHVILTNSQIQCYYRTFNAIKQ